MNIDELEKLARAATPGPWEWDSNPCDYDPLEEAPWIVTKDGDPVLRGVIQCDLEADADYVIAANPAAILELIEHNKKMRNALLRIAKYPQNKSDELSYTACRLIARDAIDCENGE